MKCFIVILSSAMLLLAGCATTPVGNAASVSPVGIVSIVSNDSVEWNDARQEERNSQKDLLGLFVKGAAKNSNDGEFTSLFSGADELITFAEKVMRDKLSLKGLVVMEPSRVLGTVAYQNSDNNNRLIQLLNMKTTPKEYHVLNAIDRRLIQSIATETGLNHQLAFDFAFKTEMTNGLGRTGSCKAQVRIVATIYDKDGKVVARRNVCVTSKDHIGVVAGVYNVPEMKRLFDDAINAACQSFVDSYVA